MLSSLRMAVRQSNKASVLPRSSTAGGALRFNSSKSGSEESKHTPDSTSKEVLAAEAAAEADRALTQHRAEGDHVAAAAVSGAPTELTRRPVRIYQPSQESTQSAKATSWHWRIDWDTLPGAGRWENALMGWQSTADYLQGTHLKFNTKQDAINFAEKQGYPYFVQEPKHAKIPPKSYSDNFLYSPGKIRYIRTK
ncbi:hypothetical protein P389DRAFT_171688 [Cystobasidium minutum MCA 4210]|uniref:uncharacterized protein n=1 Tax=Cystobasidium minutum MCA 4210 TaxID=1397322 RepID=UPI0034CD5A46|eukprot:jgi/Rhomi1/171688/fgenesh1_kg.4_\